MIRGSFSLLLDSLRSMELPIYRGDAVSRIGLQKIIIKFARKKQRT